MSPLDDRHDAGMPISAIEHVGVDRASNFGYLLLGNSSGEVVFSVNDWLQVANIRLLQDLLGKIETLVLRKVECAPDRDSCGIEGIVLFDTDEEAGRNLAPVTEVSTM